MDTLCSCNNTTRAKFQSRSVKSSESEWKHFHESSDRKDKDSDHLQNETLLHEPDCSGAAAHSADTPVSTSKPSDSKDLHLFSTEEEEDRQQISRGSHLECEEGSGNTGEQGEP